MITIIFKNTRMLWFLITKPRQAPFIIIRFILKQLKNYQHPCKCMRVEKYGALKKPTGVTELLVNSFNIDLENTGGYASWINRKNELHIRIINTMITESLVESNKYAKNGAVKLKHPLKYIDEKLAVQWTTHHITLDGMLKPPLLNN